MNDDTNRAIWESFWGDASHHGWWTRPAPEILEFIAEQSPEERPDVLDLGCGLGRHAIAFAQAGFRVTATDASEKAVAHLKGWAEKASVRVDARVGTGLDGIVASDRFDIVLSYNVIYHGSREEFAGAVNGVHGLLRRGGLFYFTCPTRDDGKYGFGEEVAPHTFRCAKSITPGDIHHFADEADLAEMLSGFGAVTRRREEGYWRNGDEEQFYSNWHVIAGV